MSSFNIFKAIPISLYNRLVGSEGGTTSIGFDRMEEVEEEKSPVHLLPERLQARANKILQLLEQGGLKYKPTFEVYTKKEVIVGSNIVDILTALLNSIQPQHLNLRGLHEVLTVLLEVNVPLSLLNKRTRDMLSYDVVDKLKWKPASTILK